MSFILGLFGSKTKLIIVAAVAFLVIGYIGYLKITVANLRTINATISADRDTALSANERNAETIQSRERRHLAEVTAMANLLARAQRVAKTARANQEELNVAIAQCSGIPPAGRVIIEQLRRAEGR